MSPHNVNNFVSDLVLMAKAMEELPQVREELTAKTHLLDEAIERIQTRELAIIGLKGEIDTHLATIRTLEVARDDAELRFLELDEKVTGTLRMVEDAEVLLIKAREALTPPKPEPVPTTQPIEAEAIYRVGDQDMGHGSSEPTPSSDQGSSASPLPQSESWAGAGSQSADVSPIMESHSVKADPSPGQSEADPTVAAEVTSGNTPQQIASSGNVKHETNANSQSGKYSNKLYAD